MGTLFVVATPIGNLEDITLRALRILKEVDLIACEDTRRTGLLLRHFGIDKPLISYHQHTRLQKIEYLIGELKKGKDIAQVSDAGTPSIADPGGVLIAEALKNNIKVEPIPGVSALTTLASVVGVPLDKFFFLGYLPKKKGRQTLFSSFKDFPCPIIFFESPERIKKTLTEIETAWGNRQIIIGRELTKKFEEIYRGKISQILDNIRPQGELIVIVLK